MHIMCSSKKKISQKITLCSVIEFFFVCALVEHVQQVVSFQLKLGNFSVDLSLLN